MTKKQAFKIVAYIITIALLTVFFAVFLNYNKQEECVRVYGFYQEPEKSIDVSLIGSSEFYRGYLAPLAYEEAGFTSYAVSLAAMPASLYKSIFNECRRRHDSQLYVVEVNGVYYKNQLKDGRLREWFDNMPMSKYKIEDIKSIVPKEDWSSYFINFEKYHSNWSHVVKAADIMYEKSRIKFNGYSYLKGYDAGFYQGPDESNEKKQRRTMTKEGRKYMTQFLEYLKDEGVDNVLFVRWPHRNKFDVDGGLDDVKELIEGYGFDFVNFGDYSDEIGMIPDEDFYDNEHLNPIGTEKMTKYFANYIMENYDIKIDHAKEVDEKWEKCVEVSKQVMVECKKKTINCDGGRFWKERKLLALIDK